MFLRNFSFRRQLTEVHECVGVCQQKCIDVLEKTEIKLLRLSKQVTNNEYIITIIKDNRVMQVIKTET